MFRWYRESSKCYVYISDVSTDILDQNDHSKLVWESAFRKSRRFTRGWTLQELIAPEPVQFFSRETQLLGDKKTLERQVHKITGIPVNALQEHQLHQFSVDERMLWAEKRETKRREDKAYSLMGIFDIHMPLIYGEGREGAFARLRETIDKRANSKKPNPETHTMLAASLVHAEQKSPSSTVPCDKDLNFVGRRDILLQLESILSQQGSRNRAVLAGQVEWAAPFQLLSFFACSP